MIHEKNILFAPIITPGLTAEQLDVYQTYMCLFLTENEYSHRKSALGREKININFF